MAINPQSAVISPQSAITKVHDRQGRMVRKVIEMDSIRMGSYSMQLNRAAPRELRPKHRKTQQLLFLPYLLLKGLFFHCLGCRCAHCPCRLELTGQGLDINFLHVAPLGMRLHAPNGSHLLFSESFEGVCLEADIVFSPICRWLYCRAPPITPTQGSRAAGQIFLIFV